ncbi:MAG TPA: DnaJ C-terminal domain-containing protein [Prosthecobacter sp.]|nr:DnaJ C-terminal domain-containing protein [Prosthecobacter sp.]
MKFKDYYEVLGLPRTATAEEIKSAFRKLARQHHPDVAKDKTAAEAKFKEVNEAYEVLRDPEKRRKYDELGANWRDDMGGMPQGAGGPWQYTSRQGGDEPFEFGGTGFSDFFEQFFGGGGGYAGFGTGRRGGFGGYPENAGGGFAQRGQDVEADIMVTLEEAFKGATRKITLRRPATATEAERTDTYQVRIPAGVREGQRIRLAGQGGAGHGGASKGDLFLHVRLARHPDFSVREPDLLYDLDLAPWEAALGAQVKIPTLDGATSLRVPAGTGTGHQLRLRGLGLPKPEGGRGDLYATVRVQVPAAATPEERALWEQLAQTSTFKPRSES